MTENKRFTLSDRDLNEVANTNAIADGGIPCTQRQVCKLLNELNDENEQLKQQLSEKDIQLNFLQDENKHMKTVLAENRELKTLNNAYLQDLEVVKAKVNDVTVAVEIATEEQMQKVFKTINDEIRDKQALLDYYIKNGCPKSAIIHQDNCVRCLKRLKKELSE